MFSFKKEKLQGRYFYLFYMEKLKERYLYLY